MSEMQRETLVVLASADRWMARALESILAPNGFTVRRARRPGEPRELIRHLSPDLVLVDAAFADGRGLELCRTLRAEGDVDPSTPILIAGQHHASREARVSALRAGAWDYFAYPFDAEELLLKVGAYVRCRAATDEARMTALVDAATGCYNPRGLLRRAQEMGSDATRHPRAIACITLAPDAGAASDLPAPEMVHEVGRVLDRITRGEDVVGRMGRSEFVVLAPGTDEEGAVRLAERISRSVEAGTSSPDHPPVRLRAGCYAVSDFRAAAVEPVEMMVRATLALRRSQNEPGAGRIQLYGAGSSPS